MTTSTLVPAVDHTWPLHTAITADGHYLVFANFFALEQTNRVADLTLDVFRVDTTTGKLEMVTGPRSAGLPRGDMPAITSDGMRVAYRSWTDNADGTSQTGIAVKDMATGATVQVAGKSGSTPVFFDDLSMSNDGRLVAYLTHPSYSDNFHESIVVQDVRTKQVVYRSDDLDNVKHVQLSGDGKSLLVADDDLRVVNVATGASRVLADWHGDANGLSISTDGHYVLYTATVGTGVAGASDADIALVRKDMESGAVKVVQQAPASPWNYSLSSGLMSPDGHLVAFAGDPVTHAPMSHEAAPLVMDMETGAITQSVQPVGYASAEAMSNGAIVYMVPSEVHPQYITEGTLKLVTIPIGGGLNGSQGNDVLTGTGAEDKLFGQGGNDRLTGGAGNDVIDGGAGLDTAVYAGTRDAYEIVAMNGTWTVRDKSGHEGTDKLTGVERLHFADLDVALDVNGTAGQVYRLYQAAFARQPDLEGLGFWIKAMDEGASLNDVSHGFVGSEEFAARYGAAPNHRALVEQFYLNVLHRPGEAEGVDWWTTQLDNKVGTVFDVLTGFSESAENQAALVGVLANGIEYKPFG